MANWKKLAQGAAGAAGAGEALNVEDVFSTYLYHGTQTQVGGQTITNNIDLATEGGMVWFKARDAASSATITDTDMGAGYYLQTASTAAKSYASTYMTSFNTDGFTLGAFSGYTNSDLDYASWTFRKAPKFFDVVTYTGDGNSGRTVSHSLGSVPGCIIVKQTNSSSNWMVYHRGSDSTAPEDKYLNLHSTNEAFDFPIWNDTPPTSTNFTVGNNPTVNENGSPYVAYLFAHNDGDGDFGPDGDADIIKCGSYTGGNGTDVSVDLGFEPQWVMVKKSSGTANWVIADNMRGISSFSSGNNTKELEPNTTDDESFNEGIRLNPDGFTAFSNQGQWNGNGTYIYIAIRRGPMAVPESADDVFAVDTWGGTVTAPPAFYSGWPVDAALNRSYATTANNSMIARLTDNKAHFTNTTSTGTFGSAGTLWDLQDGVWDQTGTVSTYISHMWRRAPNFFDVVAYTGNSTAGRTVSHNLGVEPEMIWVKSRTDSTFWAVYHKDVGYSSVLRLDTASTPITIGMVSNTSDTDFTLGSSAAVNGSGHSFTAFLFASLAGVSKVGTYTGSTSDQNIDCGFSNGARLVIIKAKDNGTDWYLFSEDLGITTATDDPIIILNSNSSEDEEYTGYSGAVSPYSGGFKVIGDNNEVNRGDGRTYIFYAVA